MYINMGKRYYQQTRAKTDIGANGVQNKDLF